MYIREGDWKAEYGRFDVFRFEGNGYISTIYNAALQQLDTVDSVVLFQF